MWTSYPGPTVFKRPWASSFLARSQRTASASCRYWWRRPPFSASWPWPQRLPAAGRRPGCPAGHPSGPALPASLFASLSAAAAVAALATPPWTTLMAAHLSRSSWSQIRRQTRCACGHAGRTGSPPSSPTAWCRPGRHPPAGPLNQEGRRWRKKNAKKQLASSSSGHNSIISTKSWVWRQLPKRPMASNRSIRLSHSSMTPFALKRDSTCANHPVALSGQKAEGWWSSGYLLQPL